MPGLEDYLNNLGTQTETEVLEQTGEQVEEQTEEVVEQTEEQVQETEAEVVEEIAQPEVDIDKLPVEKKLAIASKLFGMEFTTEAEVESFKAKFSNLESAQKHIELIPKLVEKIKSSQNILSYFPDEAAYKVAQLSKSEEYKGKEAVISKVLHSNIAELPSLEVLELAARLDAPVGARNPLRLKLRSMGLDPDNVTEGYDSLSEDDKDQIDYAAAAERKVLSKLGGDIQIPVSGDTDILAEYEQESLRSKEDLAAKRTNLAPISKALAADLKELEITDGFKYVLDMNSEERKEYEDFISDTILSGEYDLSTERGKAELWEAVQDLAYVNNRKKISVAHEKFIREQEQSAFRQKSNNASPIKKDEPAPIKTTEAKLSPQAQAVMEMIEERR
jgi:hypothetical protein